MLLYGSESRHFGLSCQDPLPALMHRLSSLDREGKDDRSWIDATLTRLGCAMEA